MLPKPLEKNDDSTSTDNPSDISDDEEDDNKIQAKETPTALKTPPRSKLQQQQTENVKERKIPLMKHQKIHGLAVMKVSKCSLLCNECTACF